MEDGVKLSRSIAWLNRFALLMSLLAEVTSRKAVDGIVVDFVKFLI